MNVGTVGPRFLTASRTLKRPLMAGGYRRQDVHAELGADRTPCAGFGLEAARHRPLAFGGEYDAYPVPLVRPAASACSFGADLPPAGLTRAAEIKGGEAGNGATRNQA